MHRKVPNINPGLIDIYNHILEGLYSRGLQLGELKFGGHFVLVSAYQDLIIYHYIEQNIIDKNKLF